MGLKEYFMSLDPRLFFAALVIIVIIVQVILFFLLSRKIKKGLSRLENKLKVVIRKEIRLLAGGEEARDKENSEKEIGDKENGEEETDEAKAKIKPGEEIPVDSALHTCLRMYNAALTSQEEMSRFFDQYWYIRVDVINAVERRRNPSLKPVFQSADNGDYYVVKLQIKGRASFAVLPRFGLVIRESTYIDGAFGDVFDCPGFNQRFYYRIGQVIQPAYFSKESDDNWKLIKKGELELIPD